MRLHKEKWDFHSLDEVHLAANAALKFAMFNERSRRWPKVAESYKHLLWLVDRSHFPKDYDPPTSYAILMYELHYHLGVALQRLDQHRKAVGHFTKAIQAVSIPKGGCLAGCVTNSCLMTPILARRSFGYAKIGDLRNCLKDAENSVVLDSQNPDVYCIRALARGTRDEESLAIQDVEQGLKLNPSHVCALIIRGALHRTLAEKLNPESQSFYTLSDFKHPHMLDFYDRFLFTLSVPHTITDINLTPDKPSKKQLESNPDLYSRSTWRPGSTSSAGRSAEAQWLRREAAEPFRCGTPATTDSRAGSMRRKDYSEAIRKHMARPRTATEFLAQLERERARRTMLEQRAQRAVTARSAPATRDRDRQSQASGRPPHLDALAEGKSLPEAKVPSAHSVSRTVMTSRPMTSTASRGLLSPCLDRPGSAASEKGASVQVSCDVEGRSTRPGKVCLDVETTTMSGRTSRTTCTKTFQYDTPTNYSIPVFQNMNIKDAPRMYYRPWRGDKLPVADVPHPTLSPAFY